MRPAQQYSETFDMQNLNSRHVSGQINLPKMASDSPVISQDQI
jgi:hypothetical protein